MWKTISQNPVYRLFQYLVVNGITAAGFYYGLIVDEPIEGALNISLFICWATVVLCFIVMLGLIVDGAESNDKKGEMRQKIAREMPKSVVPFAIDLMYDIGVLCVLVWFGYYVLAAFYIMTIYVGKELRDIPKNLVLKNLTGQQQ